MTTLEVTGGEQLKAMSTFAARFGSDRIAYHFDGDKVVVALSPPQPP